MLHPVLHVVSGKMHEVSEQECLHFDCCVRVLVLQSLQESVLFVAEKHSPCRCCEHGWGLCIAIGQGMYMFDNIVALFSYLYLYIYILITIFL